MGKKKTKAEANRKRKISPWWAMVLFAVVGGVAFGLVYVYVGTSKVNHGSSHSLYEEIYSTPDTFQRKTKHIEQALYDSLYQSGTPEKNIHFLRVRPMHRHGYFWDFTEILVKTEDTYSAEEVLDNVVRDISELDPEINLEKRQKPDGRLVVHVYLQGLETHEITLVPEHLGPRLKRGQPKIAIIVDDLGHDVGTATLFLGMDIPFTYSVLPSAPYTRDVVKRVRNHQSELMLHLPMEPKEYPSVRPGPGALFLDMAEEEIRDIVAKDLREVKGACGVNNHMGSSFTENREKMLVLLKELKRRNLFFVDSLTTGNSVSFSLAKEIGLPAGRRDVFLDNSLDSRAIEIQLKHLFDIARRSGKAIGIAHPHKESNKVLREYISRMGTTFEIVPVSELVSMR